MEEQFNSPLAFVEPIVLVVSMLLLFVSIVDRKFDVIFRLIFEAIASAVNSVATFASNLVISALHSRATYSAAAKRFPIVRRSRPPAPPMPPPRRSAPPERFYYGVDSNHSLPEPERRQGQDTAGQDSDS